MRWLCALLLIVACDQPKPKRAPVEGTTEPTKAEIGVWLKRSRNLDVTAVDCPPSVPVEKGYAFLCTATATDGSTATVMVEFVDGSGVTKMTLKYGIVVAAEVEAALRDAGTADCGKRIRPAKVGRTFACKVGDDSVEVVIEDERGGFRVR